VVGVIAPFLFVFLLNSGLIFGKWYNPVIKVGNEAVCTADLS
jgi:hypothetical protein